MDDPPQFTCLIPDLPDEISVQIIARVPRSHHQTLCHVSRSWRSLLLKRLLFTLRSSLHCAEPTLCLNIHTPAETDSSQWLVLNRGHFLPSRPLPTGFLSSACAAVGPFVFLLGGSLPGVPSNVVQILDLRLGGKWFLGPRLSTAREFAAVSYLNGRLYVMGGCSPSSEAWAESLNLFDRNPQWVPIDSPRFLRNKWMHGCLVLSGQIVAMAGQFVFAYDPGQNTGSCPAWVPAPEELDLGWRRWAVVVNNIVYSYDYTGKIVGYDAGMDKWSTVLGVDKNIPKCKSGVTLANLNGILCVIWREQIFGSKRKEMAVDWVGIEVTNLGSEGLHGSILWQETVSLDLPCGSSIAHCVVAEF